MDEMMLQRTGDAQDEGSGQYPGEHDMRLCRWLDQFKTCCYQ